MADGWRKNLIDLEPYVPGEQRSVPGLVKLNTNENPYPPSPQVLYAVRNFDAASLRKYPNPTGEALRTAIGARYGVSPDCVFVGNGSDEVLAFAFRAVFNGSLPVLFPDITYSFYPVWCRFFGIPFETVPLDGDFRIAAYEYERPNGGIVLCNPNAPTGIGEGQEFVEYLLKTSPDSVVIVDEAYGDFGGWSAVGLTGTYENLLVCRTLSKSYSLAGLRVGYLVGSREAIAAVTAVKDCVNSYTMSNLAVEAAIVALKDEAYFQANLERVLRTRYQTMNRLRALGFTVLDSQANFIFVSHPDAPAQALYEYLGARNILVRWFAGPRVRDFLRISIGMDADMETLLAAIEAYLKEKTV
ncbi:MAG: aminotransferase class I/II-fold pyridoxal phosphate-dependent enzyme [Clostridiales Family XIII bacterium]|jgi:histidinol-phosphate aminotransferase|nr:aminotransferase class I/II-fold pyridoxal phosphate-dependent enzyme [Clostridiales Family XIII bacterium]